MALIWTCPSGSQSIVDDIGPSSHPACADGAGAWVEYAEFIPIDFELIGVTAEQVSSAFIFGFGAVVMAWALGFGVGAVIKAIKGT